MDQVKQTDNHVENLKRTLKTMFFYGWFVDSFEHFHEITDQRIRHGLKI